MVTLEPETMAETVGFWQAKGFFTQELEEINVSAGCSLTSQPTVLQDRPRRFAVGNKLAVSQFFKAWHEQNTDEIGGLLGYPKCCRNSYKKFCIDQRYFDPTWPIAVETCSITDDQLLIQIEASAEINVFWRSVGVRCVPHLPCRFDCAASLALSQRFLDAAMRHGFIDEVQWLREILSWPLEWSALHGIAEIKTPILKICTKTDFTRQKAVARRFGQGYPNEGGQGITFPYHLPQRKKLTESPGFQRGLINLAG
jgi:hypothetical protein